MPATESWFLLLRSCPQWQLLTVTILSMYYNYTIMFDFGVRRNWFHMQSPNLACPVAESAIRPVGQRAIAIALLEEDRHPGSHVRYNSIALYDCVQACYSPSPLMKDCWKIIDQYLITCKWWAAHNNYSMSSPTTHAWTGNEFIHNNQKHTKNYQHSIYYKTGHAVSFSSTQRMEPTELPTHVKGAWQVTLSRWPDQEKELVLGIHPMG